MENKQRYQLTKADRLKSRKAIELLFKDGKSFSLFPFKIIYLYQPNEGSDEMKEGSCSLQTAFSVSKKYFKKATERNRVKRLIRETYRLQKATLKNTVVNTSGQLNVFILYIGNEIPEYNLVFGKVGAVLKRLQKIVNENIVTNT